MGSLFRLHDYKMAWCDCLLQSITQTTPSPRTHKPTAPHPPLTCRWSDATSPGAVNFVIAPSSREIPPRENFQHELGVHCRIFARNLLPNLKGMECFCNEIEAFLIFRFITLISFAILSNRFIFYSFKICPNTKLTTLWIWIN